MRKNIDPAVMSTSLPTDYERLQTAFAVFNEASEQLSVVYQDLQQQVEQLTRELALANGELQRQLAEKEDLSRRLSLLLTALPAGVIALDAKGYVEQANPAASAILGEPLVGLQWHQNIATRLLETTVVNEWNLNLENTKNHRRIRVESSTIDSTGRQILLVHDITQAYAMQEQVKRNQRLTAMGEMAANLAHQLRTPLSTALLYAAHLGNETLATHERQQFAAKTAERLHHLERLINDMLRFVKGEATQLEKVSAASLLAALRHEIEPQMLDCDLQFIVRDNSHGACLMADRKALCGAMINLLENAMQVSHTGDRVLLACDTDKDSVILTVSDDGPGIDTALQARLFEPFFTTRSEGTGLGLAIARGVIQSMGGSIHVNTVASSGSEFLIKLPRQLSESVNSNCGEYRPFK
ncbi:PAS domain-containing sensor histidine kinase [Nitrosomonas sp.]|uniref:sensor histidine kinase n=1 Tax=Nitrosomonas sp. TaxID=42353 RepID=UPI0025D8EB7A|nr:ATP-binding protein [Nitrosomonas sp.]